MAAWGRVIELELTLRDALDVLQGYPPVPRFKFSCAA